VLDVLAPGTRLGVRGYSRRWIAAVVPDGTRGYVSRRDVRAVVAVPLASAPNGARNVLNRAGLARVAV
jgi:hypothetical protein